MLRLRKEGGGGGEGGLLRVGTNRFQLPRYDCSRYRLHYCAARYGTAAQPPNNQMPQVTHERRETTTAARRDK